MLHLETSVAYSEIHKNHRNTFNGQNVEFLNLNPVVPQQIKEVTAIQSVMQNFSNAICDCQCELHL